jgi:hypothetical protein
MLLTVLVGCGPRVGTVSGEVKFKGQPVDNAVIRFHSQTGQKLIMQGTVEKGQYTVRDVPAGPAQISIQVPLPAVIKGKDKDKDKDKGKKPPKTGTAPPDTGIPAKYSDPAKSGLTYTVTGGNQTAPPIDLQP